MSGGHERQGRPIGELDRLGEFAQPFGEDQLDIVDRAGRVRPGLGDLQERQMRDGELVSCGRGRVY
jgi:hypothetical protein